MTSDTMHGRDAGFTLVELLVGLALLALMTTLLSGALGGVRQTQRSHDRTTLAQSIEPPETHLRRVVADMRPIRSGTPTAPLIGATRDSLSFLSGYSPPGGYAGLQRIMLRLVPAAREGLFDIEEVRALHRPGRAGDAEVRTRLVTNVAGMELRYWGGVRPTGPVEWLETWARSDQLPQLVSIEVRFPPGDVRRWPPLVIATPAGV